jgi:hypothetical protein
LDASAQNFWTSAEQALLIWPFPVGWSAVWAKTDRDDKLNAKTEIQIFMRSPWDLPRQQWNER